MVRIWEMIPVMARAACTSPGDQSSLPAFSVGELPLLCLRFLLPASLHKDSSLSMTQI